MWPADDEWTTTFIVSVDGTHRDVEEVRDANMRKNPTWYSHKSNSAGVNHEIALHLFEDRCVHCKSWDVASKHDKTIFKEELCQKIPAGKRVIVDKGYDGLPETYSCYNQFDTVRTREFKKRAKARQESFNWRLNIYDCVSDRFRHKVVAQESQRRQEEKQELCFDAVLVLVQYEIEDTNPESAEPLFTI